MEGQKEIISVYLLRGGVGKVLSGDGAIASKELKRPEETGALSPKAALGSVSDAIYPVFHFYSIAGFASC